MFYGKCSKCEKVKMDFILKPTSYDVLLCNNCLREVRSTIQNN